MGFLKYNIMWQQSWSPPMVCFHPPCSLYWGSNQPYLLMKLVFKQWFFFVLHTIYIMLGELFWHKLQIDNKMQMDHIWLCKTSSYMGLSHEMQWNCISCRNPTLRELWGRHSHSWKWDLVVLRDSQKLKAQLQGSKHLALKRSLYHWKFLEA